MSGALLSGVDLGKRYLRRGERSIVLGALGRKRTEPVWALRGAHLEVHPGEVVAAIGRNGAGKSTLLKLAAGVTRPTEGTLKRPRRVAPLIEVGAGFHPDLSGRENVEINARLLGMTAAQARRRFDEIVAFSDLQASIDQPVRQYSSGMYMRLGFAVAVHTAPELLVVDEVLAVGDLPFQVKCLDRIRSLKEQGVGVLFVSHNLTAVLNLADRALLLDGGREVAEGDVTEVVGAYHQLLGGLVATGIGEDAGTTGALQISDIVLSDETGTEPTLWRPGQRATVTFRVRATAAVEAGAVIGIQISKQGAGLLAHWSSAETGPRLPAMKEGDERQVRLDIDLHFGDGQYAAEVAIAGHDLSLMLCRSRPPITIGIGPHTGSRGMVFLRPHLEHEAT